MQYECKFALGDKVIIDQSESIVAIVIAVQFYSRGCEVRVSYFSDSGLQEPWIDEFRLEKYIP